jgi:hypothetical protein
VTSVLEAALIGAGGSVVGGIIGGWFALLAVRSQWKRDRADARADRSHQAALSIAESVTDVEEVLVAWSAGQADQRRLRAAFNSFSRTAAVQTMALTDDSLRQRVRAHVQLLMRVALLAEKSPAGSVALTESARRHADALIEALEAHYTDTALPPYQPLPMNDVAGLLVWRPVGAEPARKDGRRDSAVDARSRN